MLQRAGARGPQHPDTVGIVDGQQRPVARAGRGHGRQRRQVTVHAEHAVGEHEAGAVTAPLERGLERGSVGVVEAQELGPRQAPAVEQRGVVQAVLEHGVARPGQCAREAEVGHVAGGEQQRPLAADERSERFLQRVVLAVMAGDQVRGAAAHAAGLGCTHAGLGHARVMRQAEIVVRTEGQAVAAIHREPYARGAGFDDAPAAVQPLCVERSQPRRQQRGGQVGSHACTETPAGAAWPVGGASASPAASGRSPRRANSWRSWATSGLPVVSSFSP